MELISLVKTNHADMNTESVSVKLTKKELMMIRSGLDSKCEYYKDKVGNMSKYAENMERSYKSLFNKFNNLYCLSNGNIREVKL